MFDSFSTFAPHCPFGLGKSEDAIEYEEKIWQVCLYTPTVIQRMVSSPRESRERSAQNFSRFSFVNTLRTSNSPVLSSLQSRLSTGFLHCQQFWFLCIMDAQTRKDSIDQQTPGRSDCKNALTTVCSALPPLIFTAGGIRDAARFLFFF